MRAIFFLLLAVNVAFFAQQYFFAGSGVSIATVNAPGGSDDSRNNLQLLAEHSGKDLPIKKTANPDVVIPPAESTDIQAPLCVMLGPYEQLLQAEYAVERLSALGGNAHIATLEIKAGESFWVYKEPEVSEREALNRLYELQKKNIESHIITKGELANGISFGRFSSYAEAEQQLTTIKNLGYEVQIKIMDKTIQETWVVLDAINAEKIDTVVWLELLSRQNGLEKRQNFCLGVASK